MPNPISRVFVVLLGRMTGLSHLLVPKSLVGWKGGGSIDLVFRSNVVTQHFLFIFNSFERSLCASWLQEYFSFIRPCYVIR
jgi:hypothetical protein